MKLLEEAEERVRIELKEAISSVCKSRINFDFELSIDGLLGITLDKNEVILVSIKETMTNSSEGDPPLPLDLGSEKNRGKTPQPPVAHSHNTKFTPSHWEMQRERHLIEKDYSDVPLKIPKLDFMNVRSRAMNYTSTNAKTAAKSNQTSKEERSPPVSNPQSQDFIVVQPESPSENAEDLTLYSAKIANDQPREAFKDHSTPGKHENTGMHPESDQPPSTHSSTSSNENSPAQDRQLHTTNFPIRHSTERHKRKSDPVKCQRLDSIVSMAVERVMKHDTTSVHDTENTQSNISGKQDGDSIGSSVSEEESVEMSCVGVMKQEEHPAMEETASQSSADLIGRRSQSSSPTSRKTDEEDGSPSGIKQEPVNNAAPGGVIGESDSHARWLQSIAAFVQGGQPYSPGHLPSKLPTSVCITII